jgi:hypothetical protein
MDVPFLLSEPPEPALQKPALPVPKRKRWQPLRLGLVELYHYDSEEFWFRDGASCSGATTAPASPRCFP